MQKCRVCGEEKEDADFYWRRDKGKLTTECRVCRRKYVSAYQKSHREAVNAAERRWKSKNRAACNEYTRRLGYFYKYGITVEQKATLLESQGNRCAICKGSKPKAINWVTDHKRGTSPAFIRGILCGPCNTALGLFYENPVVLQEAINYLDRAEKRLKQLHLCDSCGRLLELSHRDTICEICLNDGFPKQGRHPAPYNREETLEEEDEFSN